MRSDLIEFSCIFIINITEHDSYNKQPVQHSEAVTYNAQFRSELIKNPASTETTVLKYIYYDTSLGNTAIQSAIST